MDLETVLQSKLTQKGKYKYHILIIYLESEKITIDNLINKAEIEA